MSTFEMIEKLQNSKSFIEEIAILTKANWNNIIDTINSLDDSINRKEQLLNWVSHAA